MLNASVFQCPDNNRVVFALLFCFAILSSLILIANPGFYSHDEIERADIVLRYGFSNYFSHYVKLHPGSEFGVPIRPVSFFIQGIVSLFLYSFPFLVHLIDVLMHGTVAALMFETTRRLHGNRQLAWAGAIIFLISPLTTFSVGWSAALMDRLYILFGLIAFISAHTYISQERGWTALLVTFVASVLAILSKETALVLPGVLIVYLIFSLESIRSTRLWIAFAVWIAPVFLYLLYRAPALMNSFSGEAVKPYSFSLANVPEGIFIYAIYPFLPFLTEAHVWNLQSSAAVLAAVVAHVVLLVMLWRAFSYRVVLAYLAGYLIFLIPVLPIPSKGSHYLYGSGLAFSLALGALLTLKWRRVHRVFFVIPIGFLIVAVSHSLLNQNYFYKTGVCMNSVMTSIESAYLADGGPAKMSILVESGAPAHVLMRFAHKKKQIGASYPVKFQVVHWGNRNAVKTNYLFNANCLIYERSKIARKASDSKSLHLGPS